MVHDSSQCVFFVTAINNTSNFLTHKCISDSLWLENTHQGSSGRFQNGQSIVRDDVSSHAVLVDIWDKIPYVCTLSTSCVQLVVTPWTIAHQAPLSMGFSRQEYWSGLPCPPPGDLPDPGIEPVSLMSPALAGRFLTTSTTWEAQFRF